MTNTRQEVLAEINALRVMVFNLWEMHYGQVDKQQYHEFKSEIIKKMKNN